MFHRDDVPNIPHPNCWHFPGGGIEEGETPEEGIRRELKEEISFVPKRLHLVGQLTRQDGSKGYAFSAFVDSEDLYKFKLGLGEGQEINFFTLDEALQLKLTPNVAFFLPKFRSTFEKLIQLGYIPED